MDELKDMLSFVMSGYKAFANARSDGKIDLLDITHAIDPLTKLMSAVDGYDKVKAELDGMDEAKRAELVSWAKAEFDMADDQMEAVIEESIELASHVLSFMQKRGMFSEPAPEAPAQ